MLGSLRLPGEKCALIQSISLIALTTGIDGKGSTTRPPRALIHTGLALFVACPFFTRSTRATAAAGSRRERPDRPCQASPQCVVRHAIEFPVDVASLMAHPDQV